jgi:hypothetical protein
MFGAVVAAGAVVGSGVGAFAVHAAARRRREFQIPAVAAVGVAAGAPLIGRVIGRARLQVLPAGAEDLAFADAASLGPQVVGVAAGQAIWASAGRLGGAVVHR